VAYVSTGRSRLDAALTSAASFVTTELASSFATPLVVRVVNSAQFGDTVERAMTADPLVGPLDAQARLLSALGLGEYPTDTAAVARRAVAIGVVARYLTASRQLLVADVDPGPLLSASLVYEFTRALDDQHRHWGARVGAMLAAGETDAALALAALAEARASAVQADYVRLLPAVDRATLADQQAVDVSSIKVPLSALALSDLSADTVALGRRYLAWASGLGPSGLASALAHPPASTADMNQSPAGGIDQRAIAVPPAPPAPPGPTTVGTLGAQGLFEVLSTVLADDSAQGAVAGWGGDRYVIWAAGRHHCARLDVMARAGAATTLGSALVWWAQRQSGVRVEQSAAGRVRITACP
jgi:hypothetical protein